MTGDLSFIFDRPIIYKASTFPSESRPFFNLQIKSFNLSNHIDGVLFSLFDPSEVGRGFERL